MPAVETYTGRPPSASSVKRCVPAKFSSRTEACDRSQEARLFHFTCIQPKFAFQSSEARHERGT